MKRLVQILVAVVIILFLLNIFLADSNEQEELSTANNDKKEGTEQHSESIDQPFQDDREETFTSDVGLGDTVGDFKEEFGKYENQMGRIIFEDGFIYSEMPFRLDRKNGSISDDDLVWNITINFEATNEPVRTEKEVLQIAEQFLPEDAVKIGQSEVVLDEDFTTTVINYHSESLAAKINYEELYFDSGIGDFSLHLNKYTRYDFEQGYFLLKITTGNPEP